VVHDCQLTYPDINTWGIDPQITRCLSPEVTGQNVRLVYRKLDGILGYHNSDSELM
jgi:hypothetical protein